MALDAHCMPCLIDAARHCLFLFTESHTAAISDQPGATQGAGRSPVTGSSRVVSGNSDSVVKLRKSKPVRCTRPAGNL